VNEKENFVAVFDFFAVAGNCFISCIFFKKKKTKKTKRNE